MTAVPGPEQQQLVRRGEGAVVAEALNDVMGRMLTVVSKKTQVRFTLTSVHTRLDLDYRLAQRSRESTCGWPACLTDSCGVLGCRVMWGRHTAKRRTRSRRA
jgi:hypothetical protein